MQPKCSQAHKHQRTPTHSGATEMGDFPMQYMTTDNCVRCGLALTSLRSRVRATQSPPGFIGENESRGKAPRPRAANRAARTTR